MRVIAGVYFVICATVFLSCSKSSPTAPRSSLTVTLDNYGEYLDSTYYKVWSDSSWEEFYGDTTINGTDYLVLLDNSGYEYFYSAEGYAGFWPYGGTPIIFDSPLPSPPDTMVSGKTYTMQTTFSQQGVSYTLKDQETLEDTGTVTVDFGTFTHCLKIQSVSSITGGAQPASSSENFWLAVGPSDVEHELSNPNSVIYMAYGFVNGRAWGASSASMPQLPPQHYFTKSRQNLAKSTHSQLLESRNYLSKVLKGIVR